MVYKKEPGEGATEHLSARVTPAERRALAQLLRRRAEALAAAAQPPDASFAGWLRATIRQQAKAAGISIETAAPAAKPRVRR